MKRGLIEERDGEGIDAWDVEGKVHVGAVKAGGGRKRERWVNGLLSI